MRCDDQGVASLQLLRAWTMQRTHAGATQLYTVNMTNHRLAVVPGYLYSRQRT